MAVTNARVAIAGGSLGGLTAGNLLRDLGLDVTIYERSIHELSERGAGIGFLPDAARYLVERQGIALDDISTSTDLIRYLHRDGTIAHEREHRYHFSSWNTVFRNLRSGYAERGGRYELGREATGLRQDADTATIDFADGSSVEADLVVCADGVGSVFRAQLLPDAHRTYAGYVAWRGMVREDELPPDIAEQLGIAITYYFHANSQILVYPIPGADGSLEPGKRLINFVWYRNYKEGDDLTDVMTDESGFVHDTTLPPGFARPEHVAEMRAHADARLPSVISALIMATREPFIQAVFDLSIDQMAFGRACLVGDAGVVMRPHAAAGTAKAGANGWGLYEALSTYDTIPEALAAWGPQQVEIGRKLAQRTQRLGYRSQVLSNWDAPDDDTLFRLRDEGP